MRIRLLRRNFLVILGIDALLLAAAWYGAHLARFDFAIPEQRWILLKRMLPIILTVKIITFYFLDLYRGMWRYTSITDLLNIIKAATIGSLLSITLISFGTRLVGFARSVFIIDWCLTILLISGFRLSVRLCFEFSGEDKTRRSTAARVFRRLRKKRPSQVHTEHGRYRHGRATHPRQQPDRHEGPTRRQQWCNPASALDQ